MYAEKTYTVLCLCFVQRRCERERDGYGPVCSLDAAVVCRGLWLWLLLFFFLWLVLVAIAAAVRTELRVVPCDVSLVLGQLALLLRYASNLVHWGLSLREEVEDSEGESHAVNDDDGKRGKDS